MHLNFVPVASGYKRGLEKQVAFDRAIKQQDDTLNKTRPFDDWREKEVQLLEKMLLERGIERKIVRSEEHTSELQSRGHLVCRLLLEKKKLRASRTLC